MNATGHTLATIERQLDGLAQHQDSNGLFHIHADCRRKFRDLKAQYQGLLATEMKIQGAHTSDFQRRLAEWLNDDSILQSAPVDEDDEEFSTLDGFLLVEDVAMLAQFVNQVSMSLTKLDVAAANAAGFLGSEMPSPVCVENPTMVS
ncbi:Aste57867_12633 [Aphanomyces stellatus]|uniref:Aste57867_12633 protein n=1 Tax=Aphanomyces stellatus TaxID=120398 RepID=A0A485KW35_9STRA|nr:hypothetical protein As57867_012587 [Aphanomyces stellatus]VFT89483.1 Aste57867_12633 [Aphanomyces stellatus]